MSAGEVTFLRPARRSPPAGAAPLAAPAAAHGPQLLRAPAVLQGADGAPLVVYDAVDPAALAPLRAALGRVRFARTARTGGLATNSRTFGALPRVTLRRDYCTTASLAAEDPAAHAALVAAAGLADAAYVRWHPSLRALHRAAVAARVRPTWRLGATPFTSGIANQNNPLRYHYDRGNFQDVWSAMLVLRDGVEGGELVLPELGVRLACEDATVVLFDGQGLLHGVTPLRLTRPDGYRYSVVYYAMEQL